MDEERRTVFIVADNINCPTAHAYAGAVTTIKGKKTKPITITE